MRLVLPYSFHPSLHISLLLLKQPIKYFFCIFKDKHSAFIKLEDFVIYLYLIDYNLHVCLHSGISVSEPLESEDSLLLDSGSRGIGGLGGRESNGKVAVRFELGCRK
eukprot:TRINITY_DN3489_c0_g1_i5.p3 TRINITY_DN3489_c0_g1~~TRINITY_DN3489_c0_g1_i5.p3  ORF type:complete len:107 (-),score=8.52 TRINITY_DN3489_c0_g1_i5:343-663(-)